MTRIRKLNKQNIDEELSNYIDSISNISLDQKSKGVNLLLAMKRNPIGGPEFYKNLSYFEGANRIMTDLVIYHGVKWLLNYDDIPFDEFDVEFGNENKNDFDVMANNSKGETFVGEAFNVAPSFFQGKKSQMLNKLRKDENSSFRFIMVNNDAVESSYTPRLKQNEFILLVDIAGSNNKLHSPQSA